MKTYMTLAAMVLLLTGCSGADSSAVPSSDIVTPTTGPLAEKYVEAVHKIVPASMNLDDSDVVATGIGLCHALDLAGPDVTREEMVDVGSGLVEGAGGWVTYEDAGAMIGNAIQYYCPEYTDDVVRAVS